jgi:hypothetical protein
MKLNGSNLPKTKEEYVFGKDKKIIIDSGTSFILMPTNDRALFVKYLEDEIGLICAGSTAIPICICSDSQYA